jgi:TPR repeat protein
MPLKIILNEEFSLKMNLKNNILLLLLFTFNLYAEQKIVVPKTLLDEVENGNAEAAYFIASLYQSGTDKLMADLEQAKVWMQKAAEMQYPQAMFELAQILSKEEDKEQALDWYAKAIEYGHSDAYNSMGIYYFNGYAGLEKDCSKAYEYFETAMAKENKRAMNNYAWFLATSADKPCRNPEKALKVFYKLKAIYTSADDVIPWHVWDTESAVLAAVSDFGKAIENQKWLIEQMQENEYDTTIYEMHLKQFELRQTWIEN